MTGVLRVDADLVVESDDVRVDLWTEDGLLVVNVPSFRAARRLRGVLESIPPIPTAAAPVLETAAADLGTTDADLDDVDAGRETVGASLADVGLTIELRVRRAPVVRFGRDVRSGWLDERLLRRPGDVNWRGVIDGILRRFG